jgi:hypothetical protein
VARSVGSVDDPGSFAYAVRLRGSAVELAPGHFWAELGSDGCELLGEAAPGLQGTVCRYELRVTEGGSFSSIGELDFAGVGALTFETSGRLGTAEHARRGTGLGRIAGAGGSLAGWSGYAVSSFLLWTNGDLSEDHLGVVFIRTPASTKE